jgi:hypothetical protein
VKKYSPLVVKQKCLASAQTISYLECVLLILKGGTAPMVVFLLLEGGARTDVVRGCVWQCVGHLDVKIIHSINCKDGGSVFPPLVPEFDFPEEDL